MNKKAQGFGAMGMIIVVFIGVIAALALFNGGITSNVATATTLQTVNTSAGTGAGITLPASGGTIDLEGKSVSNVRLNNATALLPTTEYNISNNQINAAGVLTAQLTKNGAGCCASETVNISYTTQPVGYITTGGGRSLASLVIIFAALAVAVFALVPAIKSLKDNGFT